MRQTDSNIREWMTGLMRSASILLPLAMMLRSAMMLTVAVVAVLAVVSCSGAGDDPEPQPTPVQPVQPVEPNAELPILFSAGQQEETDVTRATSLEDLNVFSFRVWGYKNSNPSGEPSTPYSSYQTVFPGYVVNWIDNSANSTTTNTDGWEYILTSYPDQTLKYWDYSATAYRFFGVTQLVNKPEVNGEVLQLPFNVKATEEENAPYYSQLWFSTGGPGEPQFGKAVQLVFQRPFSRVRFMFVSADPRVPLADLHLSVPEFKPTDCHEIASNGRFTVEYPIKGSQTRESWTVAAGSEEEDKISSFTIDYTESNQQWYTVLPATAAEQGTYTLSVNVNGDIKEVVIPAEYMAWQPGYQYTYIFKVTEEGGVELGQVLSAYTDWQTGKEVDYTVYNW